MNFGDFIKNVYDSISQNGSSSGFDEDAPDTPTEGLDGTKPNTRPITADDITNAIKDANRIEQISQIHDHDTPGVGGRAGDAARQIANRHTRTTLNWKSVLRTMVKQAAQRRSFARVNTRMAAARVTAPSKTQYYQQSDIIFAIDVSGSMGNKTVDNIVNEIFALSRSTPIKNMRILFWDAKVQDDIFVVNGKKIDSQSQMYGFTGGGGTNINCVYDYIIEKNYKPSGICIMSDFYIEGDKLYTANKCATWCLITKNGNSDMISRVVKQHNYPNVHIIQTDL